MNVQSVYSSTKGCDRGGKSGEFLPNQETSNELGPVRQMQQVRKSKGIMILLKNVVLYLKKRLEMLRHLI